MVRKVLLQKLGGKWTLWDSVGFPFSFATWDGAVEWGSKNEPARRKNYIEYANRLAESDLGKKIGTAGASVDTAGAAGVSGGFGSVNHG